MPISAEVCIVGAGPVGGTLACRLAAAGVPTVVADRAPLPPMEHPAFDGRAYAIAAGSKRLLEDAGLWDKLPAASCPILEIRVSDGRLGRPASPLYLHFDHTEADAGAGPFGWMTEARNLRVALNRHMQALPDLRVFAPAEAKVARSPEAAVVDLASGEETTCRLVVAAEGRFSPLRQQAGIPLTRIPYRQTSIVCAVAHERPHGNVALEHFLPGGPFAQLPMSPSEAGPNLSAIVWTDHNDVADRMLALDDAALAQQIARRLGDHLGALRLVGQRWRYPLSASLAHRYTDTRLAVVGDAAHGIHPVAGQGLNLGFRDAIALSDLVIAAHQRDEDPGSPRFLARYQRARRADNLMMLVATDALDRLFSNSNPALRLARDVGIAAVNRTLPLKRMFMRQAMGIEVMPL
jgi:2-octaprenyl-6-methoxyphenol hydroxylase